MELSVYEEVFNQEKQKAGVDVSFKFKWLKGFKVGFVPHNTKEIWIGCRYGFPRIGYFRRIVRHEFWHLKHGGGFLNEVLATLSEFFPIILRKS